VHLAVAVELVAKDVQQQQHARLDVPQRGRHGRLVHFEDPDVAARRAAPVGALGRRGEQA
jgi:hypothetical protein